MSPRERRHLLDLFFDIERAIGEARLAEAFLRASEEDSDIFRVAFNAILYCLVVIGEAVNALPDDVKADGSEVPWGDIVGMRNLLTHEYFRVSARVVMDTLDDPLAELEAACTTIRVHLER